ncbi:MAG TPA: putative aminohydrolase SsnA [Bacillota bacterium]|nr:putative aminohydrolase SsnA [Bacillota bacterium]
MGADLILGNGVVVDCGYPARVIEGGGVAISGEIIADVGRTEELRWKYPEAGFEDVGGRLIMPGMMCAHTHLCRVFARGMQPDGPPAKVLSKVLEGSWWRLDRKLTEEDIWTSAMMSLIWCVRNGITTVFDHHHSPNAAFGSLDAIADAVARVGIRASLSYEVSDFDGPDAADEGIRENVRFIERCKRMKSPLIRANFGFQGSLTLSNETIRKCVEAPGAVEAGFHIHTAEGIEDLIRSIRRYGKPVVKRLDDLGVWNDRSLAVHCVHINSEEIEILRERDVSVVHCPESNMGNAVGDAPILEMISRGVRVGLGTDGCSCGMFESLKAADLLLKHKEADPQVGWIEAPLMAFRNNSAILAKQWDVPLDTLKPGAYADLIIVDYWAPTPIDDNNWRSHVTMGVTGGMVDSTMVNGRFLMRHRELVAIDEREIAAKSRKLARELWKKV